MVSGSGNYIYGQERRELIIDLAEAALTHAELAKKYNRALVTIDKFSSRNKEEIEAAREDIYGEELHMPYVRRQERHERRAAYVAILERDLEDPDLGWSARAKIVAQLDKLHHSIAEELGHLPTRAPSSEIDSTVRVIHEMGVDMSRAFPVKEPA